MIYADIVSTVALLAAIFSLGWQVYTWMHQKKREEAPILKVFSLRKEMHNSLGKVQINNYFVIQNVGLCGITVLDCLIDGLPINQYKHEFLDANITIIGAKIEPQNSARCFWLCSVSSKIGAGSIVKLSYQSDAGKRFVKEYTLSEGQE